MSARQMIDIAAAAGIRLEAEGEKLIAEYDGEIPAAIVADLKQHKAAILNLLRPSRHPEPRIRCEPPFGLDHVPSRFQAAWEALLTQCPPGVARGGQPGGLVWFIKGSPVTAIGRDMAQTQDGRIWRRARG